MKKWIGKGVVCGVVLFFFTLLGCGGGGGGAPPDTTNPDPPTLTADSGVQPNATVGGTVTLKATASDNSGTVAKVEFYVASDPVLACTDAVAKPSGSVFQCSWNTTGATNGTHELTIRVYDRANNSTTSAGVPFTVSNPRLTVSKAGNGSGTVSSLDGAINCGNLCTATYSPNTQVSLTATPSAGSRFDGWSGDCSGTNSTVQVTMDSDKTCTATFTQITHPVLVSINPSGAGTVTSNPQGIDCPTTCQASFAEGTAVTLTANANTGYQFDTWNGCDSVNGNQCTLTMNASKNVTANFVQLLTLTVTKNGNGTVTSNPAGIDCGSDCTEAYLSGTIVTLTATPDPGWQFSSWGGDADCTDGQVTMDADKTCTAIFTGLPTVDEGFESGNLTALPWQTGGNQPWSVVSSEKNSGAYSAQSGDISDNQTSYLEVTLNITQAGNITFYRKVSSESCCDYLRFKIDGAEQKKWSGEVPWGRVSFPVSTGTHTFRWEYTKDGSLSDGSDAGWIDDIDFPPPQGPPPTWAKTYGGGDYDEAHSIQQTSDGGYIVAGYTQSFGAGFTDFWVLKLDASGDVVWLKTYGGEDDNEANSIQQTSDGGYIVAGRTWSFGGGYSYYDFWVLKLNASGDVVWQKTYGGGDYEEAFSIQQTSDGGYIVAGETRSFGAGSADFWVLKLDASGDVVWQKTYGGGDYDYLTSIQQTSDGGYIVAGWTPSFGAGWKDVWVLKLDASGNVQWQKTYGGGSDDEANSIQQTSDGGYIVAGWTGSFGAGSYDFWVLKLDASGNVVWQKTYGGGNWDWANSIRQTSDGGYIVAGYTESFGAGGADFWVLKLDASGDVVWQKTYGGGNNDEEAYSIQQTSDGGYIVAGRTDSFGAGRDDFWVLKLDASGDVANCTPYDLVQDSDAIPASTSVAASTSSATSVTSTAPITDTSVAGQDSGATSATQCTG